MADMTRVSQKQSNIQTMKKVIASTELSERLISTLGKEEANIFKASVLELYGDISSGLAECDANDVMQQCMKAANLRLPLSKGLGFAYVIPYKGKPQFQIGYRGLIQLAQRSGQYKYINAGAVCEGETVKYDKVTSALTISGEAISANAIGYFAYFELLNGFSKSIYWTKEQCEQHARKFSKAWVKQDSPWHTNFDAMAIKTVLKQIISRYGIMSIEFAGQFAQAVQYDDFDDKVEAEVSAKANTIELSMDDEQQASGIEAQMIADDEEAGF